MNTIIMYDLFTVFPPLQSRNFQRLDTLFERPKHVQMVSDNIWLKCQKKNCKTQTGRSCGNLVQMLVNFTRSKLDKDKPFGKGMACGNLVQNQMLVNLKDQNLIRISHTAKEWHAAIWFKCWSILTDQNLIRINCTAKHTQKCHAAIKVFRN